MANSDDSETKSQGVKMAKKQINEPETKSSPIIRHLISTGFDLLKHFLRDLENTKKIKK